MVQAEIILPTFKPECLPKVVPSTIIYLAGKCMNKVIYFYVLQLII